MAEGTGSDATQQRDSVAVVIVTYNRAEVLVGCLDGLAIQTSPPDAVFVVDNASGDHTAEVLQGRTDLPLRIVRTEQNLGGAGGFHLGVGLAYDAGFDRIWLMDDDVVPAPSCLQVLLDHHGPALMAVREDTAGRLVEKAALSFDLANPFAIRPKRASVDDRWHLRSEMPAEVVLENVAFEGFMVHRRVIDAIGLPTRRTSSSTTTATSRSAPGGPASRWSGCGTRCWSASSTSTSSTRSTRGRGSTCTGTCSRSTSGTARTCWSG